MYDRSFPQQPPQQQNQQYGQPQGQQPQNPYQQNPYQQSPQQHGPHQHGPHQQPAYQQAPPPQQQYGQQQYAQQQGHPYQQPPAPYQQQPAPQGATAAMRIPEAADARRIGAVFVDGVLALGAAFLAFRLFHGPGRLFFEEISAWAGACFGFSFLNHVVLARIAGASIGKFALRTRVIYEKTGARPRVTRLFRRWLGGYLFIAIWILAAVFDSADEGPDDFCGVRLVRYRDLRAFAAAQGGYPTPAG
ncbi:RDD family protein [Streptomyces piniterrae]|uniref:RDD family protein n=1 Tax=Streptomyces piniterrae TaxID=2571125 RepID=A0A4V5MLH0_9ACTN|nr:RDD family protein [Streptomyces piniterrae]TJZ55718.1 RDD family protein [Streptomyces piniterrae]